MLIRPLGHNQLQTLCSPQSSRGLQRYWVAQLNEQTIAVVGGQCPPYISAELSNAQLGAGFTADNIVRHAVVFGY